MSTHQYHIPQSTLQIGPALNSNVSIIGAATTAPAVLKFGTDGKIETPHGDISLKDLVTVTKLMKRVMIDMAKDAELSERLPYIKEAAYDWVVDELTKEHT